jgi:multidrug resistance efflux pump
LTGAVLGIAGGVFDRQRSVGRDLLPNINPTFTWVRLAQRIPVRVRLDPVPPSVRLVSGRTATVTISPAPAK